MPQSNKPILAILASDNISYVNLDMFLKKDLGQVICDAESPIVNTVKQWCFHNNIECITWKSNYNIYDRDIAAEEICKSMLNFADKTVIFWNCRRDFCYYAAIYAYDIGIDYRIHEIIN